MTFSNLKYHQSMAKYVSLRAGGYAEYFYAPKDILELASFLKKNNKPILFLGLGSNLLIRDRGFSGVIIHTKYLNKLSYQDGYLDAQAGVSLAKLARFNAKCGGFQTEFLSTIPGSVGGALAMNAGCFGYEVWQFVETLSTIDVHGNIHQRKTSDFEISYRYVKPHYKNEYFISARLKSKNTPTGDSIKKLLAKRRKTQPTGKASCGSVFVNSKEYYAGALIEHAGLKGFCIGDACVSNQHANFIINQGSATASDIENLIEHIKSAVKSKFGILLMLEVKII